MSGISHIDWYIQHNEALPAQSRVDSVDARGSSGSSASAWVASGTEALGQNLHVFMQALYQAISNTNASSTGPAATKGQSASPHLQAYQQIQTGLHRRIESLIGTLKHPGGSSDGGLDGLQAAFNRVLNNLGTHSAGPLDAFNAMPDQGLDLTLHSWLQGLQQNLQQGTTKFSAIGSIVDVMV